MAGPLTYLFFTLCSDCVCAVGVQAPSQATVTLKVETVATSRIRRRTRLIGCESEVTLLHPTLDPEETTLLGWVSHFLIHCFSHLFHRVHDDLRGSNPVVWVKRGNYASSQWPSGIKTFTNV